MYAPISMNGLVLHIWRFRNVGNNNDIRSIRYSLYHDNGIADKVSIEQERSPARRFVIFTVILTERYG